jgi:hypothetical protein
VCKIKCDKFFLYISAVYLAPNVIEAITDNSDLCDVNLVFGDFNLPKVRRKVDEKSGSVLSLNVTTDLESDLIGGLFGCNIDQVNVVPNDNGTFLDLVFTNAPVDVSVACCTVPSPQGV